MSNIIESIRGLIAKHQEKTRQQQFLEAAMGACALLSMVDGEVSLAELMARDYILDHVQRLQMCDANEAADVFRNQIEALNNNYQEAKSKILELITPYAGDAELAPLLLRLSIAIAKADQELQPSEEAMVTELRKVLQIDKLELS